MFSQSCFMHCCEKCQRTTMCLHRAMQLQYLAATVPARICCNTDKHSTGQALQFDISPNGSVQHQQVLAVQSIQELSCWQYTAGENSAALVGWQRVLCLHRERRHLFSRGRQRGPGRIPNITSGEGQPHGQVRSDRVEGWNHLLFQEQRIA